MNRPKVKFQVDQELNHPNTSERVKRGGQMGIRTGRRAAVVAFVSGAVLAASPVSASAAVQSSTPTARDTATVSADGESVAVKVSYTCTNTQRLTHYVTARVTQESEQAPGAAYVVGFRSDTGGLRAARCTGTKVTQTLTLRKDGLTAAVYADWSLAAGEATLEVTLERRHATGYQAGWYDLMDTKSLMKTVQATLA
jgi:hypothetical protein